MTLPPGAWRSDDIRQARYDFFVGAAAGFGALLGVLCAISIALIGFVALEYAAILAGVFFVLALFSAWTFASGMLLQDRILGRSPPPSTARCRTLGALHAAITVGAPVAAVWGLPVEVPLLAYVAIGPLLLAVLACWGFSPRARRGPR